MDIQNGSPTLSADTPLAAQAATSSWIDSIRERFSGQEPWAVDLVIFGLFGFVAGFLLKNFGKIAFIVTIVSLIAILALHYTHIYDMPFERLQLFFGISDSASLQAIFMDKINFCKEHPVACLSGFVGLMIGWKVG